MHTPGVPGFYKGQKFTIFRNLSETRGTKFAILLAYFREEWVQGLRPWRRTNRRFPPVDEALTSACGGYYVRAEINRKGVISA